MRGQIKTGVDSYVLFMITRLTARKSLFLDGYRSTGQFSTSSVGCLFLGVFRISVDLSPELSTDNVENFYDVAASAAKMRRAYHYCAAGLYVKI